MEKTSWADEVDEEQVPERQVVVNSDGTKTVTEHRRTPSGRTVRLTRCIRDKIVHEHVNRA
ncbi:hypothetical protein IW136_003236, partial [Coemansia sp. RSA 678]